MTDELTPSLGQASNLAAGCGVIPPTPNPPEGNIPMFSIAYKRSLTTLAVAGGLLITAAPAGAKTESPKDQLSGVHAQQAVSDGTSNTVFCAAGSNPGRTPSGYSFGATQTGSFQVVAPMNVACDGIGA